MISSVRDGNIYYTGNTDTVFDKNMSIPLKNQTAYIVRIKDYIEKG